MLKYLSFVENIQTGEMTELTDILDVIREKVRSGLVTKDPTREKKYYHISGKLFVTLAT